MAMFMDKIRDFLERHVEPPPSENCVEHDPNFDPDCEMCAQVQKARRAYGPMYLDI